MTDSSLTGVSWDTRMAETKLHEWLQSNGYCSAGLESLSAAMEHAAKHGVAKEHRCAAKPCKGAGAALALFEIAMFHGQAYGGEALLALAAASHEAHAAMVNVRREFAEALPSFQPFARGSHAQDPTYWGEMHEHDLWCGTPEWILRKINDLTATLERFERSLREPLLSAQLRVPPRRGNRKQVLLVAVSQHLWEADFSYDEIVTLVPDYDRSVEDKDGSKHKAAVRRVVTRVREPDEREYEAWVPPADAETAPPA